MTPAKCLRCSKPGEVCIIHAMREELYTVICDDSHTCWTGPECATREEAIAAWDAVMGPLAADEQNRKQSNAEDRGATTIEKAEGGLLPCPSTKHIVACDKGCGCVWLRGISMIEGEGFIDITPEDEGASDA